MGLKIKIFALVCLFNQFAHGQGYQRFDHLSEEDGLSSNYVHSIIQDKTGYMWFGTFNGLNRYDGRDFTVFRNSPGDSSSLSGNEVMCQYEDKNGDLWIGTTQGLNLYNPVKRHFKRYGTDPGAKNNGLSNDNITDITGRGERIFVGTKNGLNVLNVRTGKIIQYYENGSHPDSRLINEIRSILIDGDKIWVLTQKTLDQYDTSFQRLMRYNIKYGGNNSLIMDDHGILWFGNNSGLNKLIPGADSIVEYRHKFARSINVVRQDRYGKLWIGSWTGGMIIFDPDREQFIKPAHLNKELQTLNSKIVWSVFESRSGLIWIGTSKGVTKLNQSRHQFQLYQQIEGNSNSLSSNTVISVSESESHSCWIGTYDGGINRIDRIKNMVVRYPTRWKSSLGLPDSTITGIFADPKGNLWVGTPNNLYRSNLNSMGVLRFTPIFKEKTFVLSLYNQNNRIIWAGTKSGLYKINKNTKDYILYTFFKPGQDGILDVDRDGDGYLWLGTENKLYSFDPVNRSFTAHEDSTSRVGYKAQTIFSDGDFVWIGTSLSGLKKYDKKKKVFLTYKTVDGLPSNNITAILKDGNSNLWVGTTRGIVKFSLEGNKINLVDPGNGIEKPLITKAIKNKNGEMFFASTQGLLVFHPDSLLRNNYPPPVVLTSIKKFNKEFLPDKRLEELEVLKLNHNELVVSFEFAALDFINPEKNQYAYKLKGFDPDWVFLDNKREVTYTNLPPGQYNFRVIASNNAGVWNESGVDLLVIVRPPFYKTWWFYILCALVLIVGVYVYIRWRTSYLLKLKRFLKHKVYERTAELQKQKEMVEKQKVQLEKTLVNLKETQNQLIQSEKLASLGQLTAGIAHEIQNPLNFINNFSSLTVELSEELKEMIVKNKDHWKNGDYEEINSLINDLSSNAEKINKHGSRANSIVRNMLMHSRKNKGDKVEVNLHQVLEEFILLAYHSIRGNNPNFSCDIQKDFDSKIITVNVIQQDISRVFLNILSNAFFALNEKKKEKPSFQPVLKVTTKKEEGWVLVSIFDNGTGIPSEIIDKIFNPFFTTKGTGSGTGLGLSMSYDIINSHGGELRVRSEEGTFTEFNVRLPL